MTHVLRDLLADALAEGWGVGRTLAADGSVQPLTCLLRRAGEVVAGAVGRTEFVRLFVHSLWVHESLRGWVVPGGSIRHRRARARCFAHATGSSS